MIKIIFCEGVVDIYHEHLNIESRTHSKHNISHMLLDKVCQIEGFRKKVYIYCNFPCILNVLPFGFNLSKLMIYGFPVPTSVLTSSLVNHLSFNVTGIFWINYIHHVA